MKNLIFAKWAALSMLAAPVSRAVVLWNESSGDLSNNKSSPSPFTLGSGANSIVGTVGGGESQDWITFHLPNGFQLSSIGLSAYSSSDAVGFTGVQPGTSFTGDDQTADPYLGYTHFGAFSMGSDLLQAMANSKSAFTPPLPAGDYVFLIQQLGSATSYQFDYNVTPVPEPRAQAAVAGVLAAAYLFRRRWAHARKLG